MKKSSYLVVWWMAQAPYMAPFDDRVSGEGAASVRNPFMIALSGRDVQVDSVLDRFRRTGAGEPMPAERRDLLGQVPVPWTPRRPGRSRARAHDETVLRFPPENLLLPSADAAYGSAMIRDMERDVTFEGATGPLRGRLRSPTGAGWGALVLCHGRHETMEGRLITTLAQRAADLGLWTLRFNFAFVETGSEPSGGHADEIADLREAIGFARATCGVAAIYVAGRGLGAWASVAAASDELAAGAILLGLSYTGQPERRMALQRLEDFEIPTLVVVGFESDRVELPLLRDLIDTMTSVNLEVVAGADHRLEDAAGRAMTEAALLPTEAWLRLRKGERTSK